jgi:hypothetical protein
MKSVSVMAPSVNRRDHPNDVMQKHSCSRHDVATDRLKSERPGGVTTVSKTFTVLCYNCFKNIYCVVLQLFQKHLLCCVTTVSKTFTDLCYNCFKNIFLSCVTTVSKTFTVLCYNCFKNIYWVVLQLFQKHLLCWLVIVEVIEADRKQTCAVLPHSPDASWPPPTTRKQCGHYYTRFPGEWPKQVWTM